MRYGSCLLPMDESLAQVALDIGGRPYFVGLSARCRHGGRVRHLFGRVLRAMTNHAGLTLHVSVLAGGNAHHEVEAVFKGLGRALRQAVQIGERPVIPSTKGVLG